MCGIFVSISRGALTPDEGTARLLSARGPDSLQHFTIPFREQRTSETSPAEYALTIASTVLALRGGQVQSQPLIDEATGSFLCWNGEAWKIDGSVVEGNDSLQIFQKLLHAATSSSSANAIAETLTAISGPFAFTFYDADTSIVYYGRDRLGRRSLVQHLDKEGEMVLCSIALSKMGVLQEVDSSCLYSVRIRDGRIHSSVVPWTSAPAMLSKPSPAESISGSPSPATVDQLIQKLSESLELRVLNIPDHGQLYLASDAARVAILFSGGLDCTLLARITHNILAPGQTIDLLNVAFENPRTMKSYSNSDISPYEICPDRITGRASFDELSSVCPERHWRFVAINVPFSESQEHRSQIIELLRPHNSEMDLSIAMALYFAARGYGKAYLSSTTENFIDNYSTTSRVLLSGLGADELFGGYSRHAAAFARSSYEGLADELDLDYQRIGHRNLGRDDRIISHWSREARYPFLDEDFVKFTLELPVWEKCGFRPDRQSPKHFENSTRVTDPSQLDAAKMALRLAAWKLGMHHVASEKKRAIQFGARTAKMESGAGRRKGTDVLV